MGGEGPPSNTQPHQLIVFTRWWYIGSGLIEIMNNDYNIFL